jgi:hypothetical protein
MLMGAPDGAVVATLKPFLLSTEQASGQRTQPKSSLLVVVVFDRSLTLNAFCACGMDMKPHYHSPQTWLSFPRYG